MSKSNVKSMYEYANNNDMYRDEKSLAVVEFQDQPHAMIIQVHLKNLLATYSREEIMDVVQILGIDQVSIKKGA